MVTMGPKELLCPACGHRTSSVLHRGQSVVCSNCGVFCVSEHEGGNYGESKARDKGMVSCGGCFGLICCVAAIIYIALIRMIAYSG